MNKLHFPSTSRARVKLFAACLCFFALTRFLTFASLADDSDDFMVFPDGPKVGDKAPPLHLAKLLNAPTNASTAWAALRGRVVVLDFWATDCPGCVASIPHMNQLIDELKGEPVQFIAITAEPEEVVAKFLKKNPLEKENLAEWSKEEQAAGKILIETFQQPNPIHAWLGLDDLTGHAPDDYYSGTTVSGYFFVGVPHCVVVDKNGVIAAYVGPEQINAKYLRAVAAGEHPPNPVPDVPPEAVKAWRAEMQQEAFTMRKGPRGPVIEVSIQRTREWLPSEPPDRFPGFNSPNPDNLLFHKSSSSLSDALKELGAFSLLDRANVPLMEFDILSPLPSAPYDFKVSAPRGVFPAVFAQAVEAAFDLDIRQDARSVEVFRMRLDPAIKVAQKPHLTDKDSVSNAAQGKIAYPSGGNGSAMSNLDYFLRTNFGKNFLIPFGQFTDLDITVTWDAAGGFEAFRKSLRKQMGLELVPDQLSVEVFHVRTKL